MADKSWMLNPKAIRHARECINIVKSLNGEVLKLSQPDFLMKLHAHVDHLTSNELRMAYSHLLSMAGVGNVLQSLEKIPAKKVVAALPSNGVTSLEADFERVEHNGVEYSRYRNGREFKGLHRGIPRYG